MSRKQGTRKRMTRAERRRQLAIRRKICWIFSLLLVIGIVMVRFTPILTHAEGEADLVHKYYKSIEIESGDTLWDIADEYCTVSCISKKSYIGEIKSMNHLKSSAITAGMKLCIPYYTLEEPAAAKMPQEL